MGTCFTMVSYTLQLAEPRQETTSFASLDQRDYETGFHTFTTLCTQNLSKQPPGTHLLLSVITGEKPTDKTQIQAITRNQVRTMTPTARKATATTKMTTYDNDYAPQLHIIPEIGDGACLLRCVSRRIHIAPDMAHPFRALGTTSRRGALYYLL